MVHFQNTQSLQVATAKLTTTKDWGADVKRDMEK